MTDDISRRVRDLELARSSDSADIKVLKGDVKALKEHKVTRDKRMSAIITAGIISIIGVAVGYLKDFGWMK